MAQEVRPIRGVSSEAGDSPPNRLGRCGLPRRLVAPETCARSKSPDESPLNPRFFLKKISFFENFVPQIPEYLVSAAIMHSEGLPGRLGTELARCVPGMRLESVYSAVIQIKKNPKMKNRIRISLIVVAFLASAGLIYAAIGI